jgi:hypothetical protein
MGFHQGDKTSKRKGKNLPVGDATNAPGLKDGQRQQPQL